MAKGSFARFYALMNKNPQIDKDELVLQFTDGRTTHLHEMQRAEFEEMCDMLQYGGPEEQAARERELKRARSSVLLRIGRLGISTVDNWEGIDAFCLSPKIAGKRFAALTALELRGLVPKLESILRKGGLKSMEEKEEKISGPAAAAAYEHLLELAKSNSSRFKS